MNLKLTPEIAEMCGIVAGDGHLSRYISKKRTSYMLVIAGHKQDDKEYFQILKELFQKSEVKLVDYEAKWGELRSYSKHTLIFFEGLGIPVGRKSDIVRMPEWIKNDIILSCAFLRGVADTDFSLVFKSRKIKQSYPRITADLKSKNMVDDICNTLSKIGINFAGPYLRNRKRNDSPCITYELDINGHKNFELWMKHIGFRNPKHLKKIKSPLPDSNFPV